MRVFVCEAVTGGGDVLKGGEYDVSVEVMRPYVLNESESRHHSTCTREQAI